MKAVCTLLPYFLHAQRSAGTKSTATCGKAAIASATPRQLHRMQRLVLGRLQPWRDLGPAKTQAGRPLLKKTGAVVVVKGGGVAVAMRAGQAVAQGWYRPVLACTSSWLVPMTLASVFGGRALTHTILKPSG